jgi:hypothetical protein
MARYLELAEEALAEIKARRSPEKTTIPFCCLKCGAHFDTSLGRAWHEFNRCADVPRPAYQELTLPSCPRCGSFAIYHLPNGTSNCQTCGHNFPTKGATHN